MISSSHDDNVLAAETSPTFEFREVHVLNVLRLLNRHCFKRRTLSLKKDENPVKIGVQLKADGTMSEHYENLLRRLCLLQGAESVRVSRDSRLTAGFKAWMPSYQIEITMPQLNAPIDVTKAMVVGDVDLFAIAAKQEAELDKPDPDDFLTIFTDGAPRTLQ